MSPRKRPALALRSTEHADGAVNDIFATWFLWGAPETARLGLPRRQTRQPLQVLTGEVADDYATQGSEAYAEPPVVGSQGSLSKKAATRRMK